MEEGGKESSDLLRPLSLLQSEVLAMDGFDTPTLDVLECFHSRLNCLLETFSYQRSLGVFAAFEEKSIQNRLDTLKKTLQTKIEEKNPKKRFAFVRTGSSTLQTTGKRRTPDPDPSEQAVRVCSASSENHQTINTETKHQLTIAKVSRKRVSLGSSAQLSDLPEGEPVFGSQLISDILSCTDSQATLAGEVPHPTYFDSALLQDLHSCVCGFDLLENLAASTSGPAHLLQAKISMVVDSVIVLPQVTGNIVVDNARNSIFVLKTQQVR